MCGCARHAPFISGSNHCYIQPRCRQWQPRHRQGQQSKLSIFSSFSYTLPSPSTFLWDDAVGFLFRWLPPSTMRTLTTTIPPPDRVNSATDITGVDRWKWPLSAASSLSGGYTLQRSLPVFEGGWRVCPTPVREGRQTAGGSTLLPKCCYAPQIPRATGCCTS